MFSFFVAVFAHSVQSPFRIGVSCLIPLSANIVRTLPYKVANFLSTIPLCCGVLEAVYSKVIPSPRLFNCSSVFLFSPALSQRMYFTMTFSFDFRFLTNSVTTLVVSDFDLRK